MRLRVVVSSVQFVFVAIHHCLACPALPNCPSCVFWVVLGFEVVLYFFFSCI